MKNYADRGECYWPRFLEYSNNQYGFKKNHSTANALIQFASSKLLDATDQGKVTLSLVIDLSKAFDTVDHQ